MVKANARLAMVLALSVTWAVKLKVPAAVGVPLIAPLDEFNVSPEGSEPALTDQA